MAVAQTTATGVYTPVAVGAVPNPSGGAGADASGTVHQPSLNNSEPEIPDVSGSAGAGAMDHSPYAGSVAARVTLYLAVTWRALTRQRGGCRCCERR